jgi:hypothetical protein
MPSRKRRLTAVRLGTSFVVLALCTFAASRGWSTAHFAMLRNGLDHPALVSPLGAWIGAPGVTTAALSATLTQMTDPADLDGAAKRLDELAALLSVRPLSSRNWLFLAEMRLVSGRPKPEVLAALKMSWVTGPNEGMLMWQRGVFGVLIWELLSPEERKLTIEQIARAMSGTPIENSELVSAKRALSQKSAEARAEIAVLMRAESELQATRLGL